MNRVEIVGRITKDIELRTTSSGKSVASFSVAVDRRKKEEGTDFIPCVAWEKTAELMNKYLTRGDRIGICGRIHTRSYEDKNGNKRNVVEVVVDEIEFLSERKKATEAEDLPPISDDDLPF